ncbi:Sec61g [Phodopus roborovskii]|uniref:Protein transport protein Sec61 subunit gamma n=1 Tax=Phodopus roborovskii TaxID=109678 RepID=A0AAV0A134_PHORO|nr:Sec61g [Phodopus roborovskii]
MDQVMQFVEPSRQFVKDSIRLVKRCTKPDRKEFQKIAMATAIGFAIMGFIGFFVKLIHIPINNIIVWICLVLPKILQLWGGMSGAGSLLQVPGQPGL